MTDRLLAWYNGELADEELTDAEIKLLEQRVFDAVSDKMLQTTDRVVFAEHGTLQ